MFAFGGTVLLIAALYFSPTVPRFSYLPLNYLFAIALALMLPITLMIFTFSIRWTWLRWIARAAAVLIFLPMAMFALLALFQLIAGVTGSTDTSFEKIAELNGNHGTYRLYRTNGGAMTSFGLVLRRERAILPGLKLVTVLRSYYPASDATLESISSARGRLTVAPYTERMQGDTFEFPD
jgi:hypothetical protein